MIRIKNEREIDRIRESCRLVVDTFKMIDRVIAVGMTTAELDRLIADHIKKVGGYPAFKGYKVGRAVFPANSCISVEDEVVHGIPSNRKLKAGDIVSVDVGIKYDGYYGDAAKTYAVGQISESKRRLMRETLSALYKGIAKAVAGGRLSDVSHAIQTHVEGAGYSVVRDLVGHGLGRKLHEDPQVPNYGKPNSGPRLRKGMVLAIEPMVNAGSAEVYTDGDDWTVRTEDGKPAAHFEHAIVIRDEQAEILTTGLFEEV